MPVEPGRFVPGRVVQDKELAHAGLGWHDLGHLIQEELKHIGIDTIDNQTKESSALGRDSAHDILSDVITQVRYCAPLAGLHPAAARPRIPFHPTLISKPQ